jgi:DNA invertase Pin-like site-specific DNA recombinase
MPIAYSYVRFSTPEQAKGDSLRRQLQLSEAYAQKHSLTLDTKLKLHDLGRSGFHGDNVTKGALGSFLQAITKGVVKRGSFLLVESLDRLSRDQISEQLTMFLNIINAGVTIVTLADEMVYSKDSINNNMGGIMYSLMIMSRAHEESATKSKRLKAAWDNKRSGQKKLTSVCPGWLRLNADRSEFIVIKDRSRIVKQIFTMADKGVGKYTITKTLNQKGIPTWRGSKMWQESFVQKVLQNRSVIGEFQPHRFVNGKRVPVGDPIVGYFPSVITPELFLRVQTKRSAGRKYPGRTGSGVGNLFSVIARCGYTDTAMVLVNKGRGGSYKYLVSMAARFGTGAKYISWKYDDFETSFLTFIKELDYNEILRHSDDDATETVESELLQKNDELGKLKKQITNLVNAISGGSSSPQSVLDKISSLETEKDELESAIRALEDRKQLERNPRAGQHEQQETLAKALELRHDTDFRYRLRDLMRQRIERIEVYPGGFRWKRQLWDALVTGSPESLDYRLSVQGIAQLVNAGYINDGEFKDEFTKWYADWAEKRNHGKGARPIEWNEKWEKREPDQRKDRLFIVYFKNGIIRFVKSDFDNPAKLSVGWRDLIFVPVITPMDKKPRVDWEKSAEKLLANVKNLRKGPWKKRVLKHLMDKQPTAIAAVPAPVK